MNHWVAVGVVPNVGEMHRGSLNTERDRMTLSHKGDIEIITSFSYKIHTVLVW